MNHTTSASSLTLQPITLGDLQLPNRVGMSAMTRMRCGPDNVPNQTLVDYYTQRATAGVILTECSPISARSNAFPGAGGIYNQAQEDGWKKVVDSVHKAGGKIIMQIWHSGNASHSTLQGGLEVWSSSAIKKRGKNPCTQGDFETAHAMTLEEIKQVVEEFRQGAMRAMNAGFDGVQLHGSNGYLVDQFLKDGQNKRTDAYGGSIENRCRFALEVIDVLKGVFGAKKVGIKLNPVGGYNDSYDSNSLALFSYLLKELDKRCVAYVEITDSDDPQNYENYGFPSSKSQIPDVFTALRPFFSRVIIGNNNFTAEKAEEYIKNGKVDMVTFGRPYIVNPDLVPRIKAGIALDTKYDYATFYGGDAKGYSDYPNHGVKVSH